MLFYSKRVKLFKRIRKNFRYYKILVLTTFNKPGNKILYIDPSNIRLNRYFYNFLKFFQIMGYVVYLPKNKEIVNDLFGKLGEAGFLSLLFQEKFIKIGKPSDKSGALYINKEDISNNYFQTLIPGGSSLKEYHVPMSEYPLIYYRYDWREGFSSEKVRKKSIFMIGNMDSELYNTIKRKNLFKILSRPDVADFLAERDYYLPVSSYKALKDFIQGPGDSKVILIDTSKSFQIKGENLKGTLKEFAFYLALPGINIPHSHNIIEAMSVGCIPVLHQTYANLFFPPLEHHINAMVYTDFESLNSIVIEVFGYSDEFIRGMQNNTYKYYYDYLTPEAVVGKIEKNEFEKIYLQAEEYSLINLKRIRNDFP